ncbi:MAG: N-6 DNA methylase [Acidobacteriia bacterium]|nr:N-6 DNA methylase [Terriglobia bacterium]
MRKVEQPEEFGDKTLAAIHSVLRRCEEVGGRLDFPGEGGERRFRSWLATEVLQTVLGWPPKQVVVGERFDILLVNDELHPVATIETKTPFHKATRKEKKDFEERLDGFPSLRTAYFTNGSEWDRLDIITSEGNLEIVESSHLNLDKASGPLADLFFAPLRHRPTDDATGAHVYAINRENAFIGTALSRLAADLDDIVAEHNEFYRRHFFGLREGHGGAVAQEVTETLYARWCDKSLRVTPKVAADTLIKSFREDGANPLVIRNTLHALGIQGPHTEQVIEGIMSLAAGRREDEKALVESLWPAFAPSVQQLCAQTSHVVLGRTLLYRVGEDEKVFPRKLSSAELEKELVTNGGFGRTRHPATELLDEVRRRMQDFLPSVYLLGEFDWWQVVSEKRIDLTIAQKAWLREEDEELERLTRRMLRTLNHYLFQSVDVDIWRNIYERYLPEDERQRLGGFYTPDELVNLVLDLADYKAETSELCKLKYVDPACGSGAFVTGALARLLAHLEMDLPCHSTKGGKKQPAWKNAVLALRTAEANVHGIDLHPFAAFLTTLNVLFILLPLYVKARDKDPDFTINPEIFSGDSLEPPEALRHDQGELFTKMNARVQLQEKSYEQYQKMAGRRYDRIFGNPPWGGVLKGQLAPVYDQPKKDYFATHYPAAAQGKYDVYGLFMERSLKLLAPGGRMALLTQGSFIDKEWARGLREFLATKSRLDYIVDLNPFGQLFFHAMNIPCLTVASVSAKENPDSECLCVISHPPDDFHELTIQHRREKVVDTVRAVLKTTAKKGSATAGFADGARITQITLRSSARERWDLTGSKAREFPEGSFRASDLLEMRQGVTPGGCLELFLMDEKHANTLRLERALVHKAIKSKQLARWRVEWKGKVLLYPYCRRGKHSVPAFTINWAAIQDEKLKQRLGALQIKDALYFDQPIDEQERDIIRESGINSESVAKLLKHRTMLGLVKYPRAAEYLIQHYDRLEQRVFEKKRFTATGKRWYEYHRPRDVRIMLRKPRILSPTLLKQIRFAVDDVGYLSDHACLMIQPTEKTAKKWRDFQREIKTVLGRAPKAVELLQYCTAFLNSSYAQHRLTTGHRPRPGEVYSVTEAFLKEVPIPVPSKKHTIAKIIEAVVELGSNSLTLTSGDEIETIEKSLQALVDDALGCRKALTTVIKSE